MPLQGLPRHVRRWVAAPERASRLQAARGFRRGRLVTQPELPQVVAATNGRPRAHTARSPSGSTAAPARPTWGLYPPTSTPTAALGAGRSRTAHDWICRKIANAAHCAGVSVDYRMALAETSFPAAFDDALAAVRWVAENASTLRIDPTASRSAATARVVNLALPWRSPPVMGEGPSYAPRSWSTRQRTSQ